MRSGLITHRCLKMRLSCKKRLDKYLRIGDHDQVVPYYKLLFFHGSQILAIFYNRIGSFFVGVGGGDIT